jgi:hypothetical protein
VIAKIVFANGPRPSLASGRIEEAPMEFGMFHEFPSLPGRSDTQAFDEAMAQVDAAERYGLTRCGWPKSISPRSAPISRRRCRPH